MATILEGEVPADLAANHVVSVNRSVTADVDEIVVHDAPEIVAGGWEDCRKNKTEFDQSIRDHSCSLWRRCPRKVTMSSPKRALTRSRCHSDNTAPSGGDGI